MAYLLIWARAAEVHIDDIYVYYSQRANKKIAKKIISEIILRAQTLVRNPFIGQREILLDNRPKEFRYIVCNRYKIIYSIEPEKKVINIVDVFDSRQNPMKISRIT